MSLFRLFCCIEVYLWGKRDTHFLHLFKSVTIPFTVNAGTELLSTRLQHETTDESAQFLHYASLQRRRLPLQLEDGTYLFVICLDLNVSSVMYAELTEINCWQLCAVKHAACLAFL